MRLGPAGPGIPRDEVRPRTKKRRVNARVKVRECSRMYRPPNPPEKFKTNQSVWLARLKPPRTIWRLCSPHCSPEENPVDAIARAVLGSVCLLDEFPECLARSYSRTKPSRLFRRRHLSKMLTPPGPVITRRSKRKVTKKNVIFTFLKAFLGRFRVVFCV